MLVICVKRLDDFISITLLSCCISIFFTPIKISIIILQRNLNLKFVWIIKF